MSISDVYYEKYIRFYLDALFKPTLKTENNSNVDVKQNMLKYIFMTSGDRNYMLSNPLSATWNLTSACNFRCIHCLYNDKGYSSSNDLSTEQALKLANELINAEIIHVDLTGGETFLRNDLMDIVCRFKENNVAVTLFTNGSLLNDKNINEISKMFNPHTDIVRISLDAATDDTFRKIRRSDKFHKINENIKKLTDKGVVVSNVCTVNIINKDEIIDIYKLSKNIGARNFIVSKMDNFNDSHYSLDVNDRELFKIYYELSKNESFDKTNLPSFWKPDELLNIPEVLEIINEPYYQGLMKKQYKEALINGDCQCHEKIAIQSDGNIYLCLRALNYNLAPLGNCKDNSFAEIWEKRWSNPLFQPRNREKSMCASCKFNAFCNGGCKLEAYISSGNVNIPAISTCSACN